MKGFRFFSKRTNPELSKDGVSIAVAGSNWNSEEDTVQLNIKPLNFAKKCCGKKDQSEKNSQIPEVLTRVQCCSKAGEVYNLRGLVGRFHRDVCDIWRLNFLMFFLYSGHACTRTINNL